VRAHPACPDDATAETVVNEVFESCVKDTRPFDEVSVPLFFNYSRLIVHFLDLLELDGYMVNCILIAGCNQLRMHSCPPSG
jgi:hypothetical protein